MGAWDTKKRKKFSRKPSQPHYISSRSPHNGWELTISYRRVLTCQYRSMICQGQRMDGAQWTILGNPGGRRRKSAHAHAPTIRPVCQTVQSSPKWKSGIQATESANWNRKPHTGWKHLAAAWGHVASIKVILWLIRKLSWALIVIVRYVSCKQYLRIAPRRRSHRKRGAAETRGRGGGGARRRGGEFPSPERTRSGRGAGREGELRCRSVLRAELLDQTPKGIFVARVGANVPMEVGFIHNNDTRARSRRQPGQACAPGLADGVLVNCSQTRECLILTVGVACGSVEHSSRPLAALPAYPVVSRSSLRASNVRGVRPRLVKVNGRGSKNVLTEQGQSGLV
jgi:hypothetical protein